MHGLETNPPHHTHTHTHTHTEPLVFSLLSRNSATGPPVGYATHEAEAWPHFLERTYLHPRVAFGPCQLLAFPNKNAEHARGVNLIFEHEVAVNGWQC